MSVKEIKQKFFETNPAYAEIHTNSESVTLGGEFQEIGEDDEVWLLQCPKGTDLTSLEGQKLKLPGRSQFQEMEAVAVEFSKPLNESFGYCNRKGKYSLRLLPLSGSVVVRNRLKANEMITADEIEALCPPPGRVPLPAEIKVRHPLLGYQYENKINLKSSIAERLRQADEDSIRVMQESRRKLKKRSRVPACDELQEISIKSEPSENGHMKVKHKKHKRDKTVLDDEPAEADVSIKKHKKKKSKHDTKDDDVSEDLSWLKNL